ncbi:MAG TPA: exodeoxyribonuclease III [Gammaproteobacteria bacterium]|nr:exodeoxyribonuclease III [Gammaproteobacteria bacterium]
MKIATWNVNSLKVRLPQVLDWLTTHQPDVLGLQETKLTDSNFPLEPIEALGYHVAFSGQPTYNGVAVLSKTPISDVVTDLPGLDDPQRRVLAVSTGGIRFVNLYVPNGQAVGTDKYAYKLDWLEKLKTFLGDKLTSHPHTAVVGDFNIALEPEDVHDPAEWEGKVLFSEPERAALRELLELGLVDTYRLFPQEAGEFSWWDYRMNNFRRNRGLRIDLVLASTALAADCTAAYIDRTPRTWERPSDHTPVVAEFRRS